VTREPPPRHAFPEQVGKGVRVFDCVWTRQGLSPARFFCRW